jgi:hypothetical protein
VLQAGDLVARGRATPGGSRQGLGTLELERVDFGRSNLENVSVKLGDDGIDVVIGRGILDAEPFLADDEAEEVSQDESSAPRSFEPLSIHAPDLRTLYFAEERHLQQVNLELRRTRAGWETIRLSGSIPRQYWSPREASDAAQVIPAAAGDAPPLTQTAELDRRFLQLSYAPDASGSGQRLLAQSDDLGALLRATNITDTVVGGRIEVTGGSDGPTPTHPIRAKVQARDFVMVKAPALAKLLTVQRRGRRGGVRGDRSRAWRRGPAPHAEGKTLTRRVPRRARPAAWDSAEAGRP